MFHDGTELTADDVIYTYDYYRNPDNGAPIVGAFTGIGSVEAPDKYTVQVNMDDVNAASLASWATVPIVQSAYHAEVGEDTYRTAPIGTGPYKLKEWRPAEFTELVAFDDHFRARPHIDVLRADIVPEPSVRMIALQTGEADSAVWPLLVEDSIYLESEPDFVVFRTLANSIKHFPLNNSIPQLAQKEVRQAMMHALDRQRIIDDLWNGRRAGFPLPPDAWQPLSQRRPEKVRLRSAGGDGPAGRRRLGRWQRRRAREGRAEALLHDHDDHRRPGTPTDR